MATRNLSLYQPELMPDASGMSFDIVVSEWNHEVTGRLLDGALEFLRAQNVSEDRIAIHWVPGSFELVYASARLLEKSSSDAVIALGCVVRGGTPHFDYVCQGVTEGISALNAKGVKPVIFGLLTTDDMQQSLDRAGGKYGNKGVEAAKTAVQMVAFEKSLR